MIVYQARIEVQQCIEKEGGVASTSSMAVRHPMKMCIRTEEQVLVLGQNLLDFKSSEKQFHDFGLVFAPFYQIMWIRLRHAQIFIKVFPLACRFGESCVGNI
jgi:hypothetical protein